MSRVCIFIRTYHRDAEFLGYLLASLERFARGFDIIIHCDTADRKVIEPVVRGRGRLVTSEPTIANGYKFQMVAKLSADLFCDHDLIAFCDSDQCAHSPFTPEHYQKNGKPEILLTSFDELGASVPWRPATEAALGERVEFEAMRSLRLQYRRETLRDFRAWMVQRHRMPLERFIERTPNFSEFCALGAWAYKYRRDDYAWLNTATDPLPFFALRQFFSGNGVTPEIRAEINRYLA